MSVSVADAVSHALPDLASDVAAVLDLDGLRAQLERVAHEALGARSEAVGLAAAVRSPRFPALASFHQDLRDAMFLELPPELRALVHRLNEHESPTKQLGHQLTDFARRPTTSPAEPRDLESALSEVLLFEAVRLRLLTTMWASEEFERLGGEESDVDEIAHAEVLAMLSHPGVDHPEVRPLHLMVASASLSLAQRAADRAQALHRSGADLREQLDMRAKLRAALRELRLTESVLLENALSSLLGESRVELPDLQEARPLALEGLSRQAMDQRVSRGRRALAQPRQSWPTRRNPALVDLLQGETPDESLEP